MSVVANAGSIAGGGAPIPLEAALRAFIDPEGLKLFSIQAQKIIDEANGEAAAIRASAEEAYAKAQSVLDEAKSKHDSVSAKIEEMLSAARSEVDAHFARAKEDRENAAKAVAEANDKVTEAEERLKAIDEAFAEREKAVALAEKEVELKIPEVQAALKKAEDMMARAHEISNSALAKIAKMRAVLED